MKWYGSNQHHAHIDSNDKRCKHRQAQLLFTFLIIFLVQFNCQEPEERDFLFSCMLFIFYPFVDGVEFRWT